MMDKSTALEYKIIIAYELMKKKMSITDYEIEISEELRCSDKTVHRYFTAACGFVRKHSDDKYYGFLRASGKYLGLTVKELSEKRKLFHELDEAKKKELNEIKKNGNHYDEWIDTPYKSSKEESNDTDRLINFLNLKNDDLSGVAEKMKVISEILQEFSDEWSEKIVKEVWNNSEREYKAYISFLYNYYEKLTVSKEFLTQILSLQYDKVMSRKANKILSDAVKASRRYYTNILNHGLSEDIINLICMQKGLIALKQRKKSLIYDDEMKGYKYNNLLVINECSPNIKFETVYYCIKLAEVTNDKGEKSLTQDCLNKAIAYAMLSKSQQTKVMEKILNIVAQCK